MLTRVRKLIPAWVLGSDPRCPVSPLMRRSRFLWIAIWVAMLFAPSIMLGFTATESKFSPAAIVAAIYVLWRLLFRPLPPLRGITGVGLLLVLYLIIHAIFLTLTTGVVIILLLEGQWIVYFVAGILLSSDLLESGADVEWVGSSLVWLGIIASIMGIISIWTGPFYSYGFHWEARWGLPINRACGTFDSPATFAGFLTITTVLSFFTPPVAHGAFRRQAGLVLMMVALLLTQSKGGILGAVAAIVLGIPFIATTAAERWAALLKLLYVGIFIGAIVFISNLYRIDLQSLVESDVHDRGALGAAIVSDYVQDDLAPQLFGIGFRQSAVIDPESGMWFPAHNNFISFLREIGLVGSIMIATFIVWSFWAMRSAGFHNWVFAMIGALLLSYTAEFFYGSFPVFFLGCTVAIGDRLRHARVAPSPAFPVCSEPA